MILKIETDLKSIFLPNLVNKIMILSSVRFFSGIMVLLGRELRAEFESAPFSIEDKFFEEIPIHRKHIGI